MAIMVALAGHCSVVPSSALAIDCSRLFPPGFFGIARTDSLVSAGSFWVQGWRPVGAHFEPVFSDSCEYVTVSDMYRLAYEHPESLLAGCYGDFNGDMKRDYAFLMEKDSTRAVLPYVFLWSPGGFRSIALEPISDFYGFDEDSTFPPGPFKVGKPSHYYVSTGTAPPDSTLPHTDYIQVGWQTYFWNGTSFAALWTSD